MELINCPACKKQISYLSYRCPYCGRPIQAARQRENLRQPSYRRTNVPFVRKKKKLSAGSIITIWCISIAGFLLFCWAAYFYVIGIAEIIAAENTPTSGTEDSKQGADISNGEASAAKNEPEDNKSQGEEAAEDNKAAGTEKAPDYFNLGDTVSLKDWDITVTEMRIAESLQGDFMTYTPDEDNSLYLLLLVTVGNNGKETDTFLPYFPFGNDTKVKLLYGDGYTFQDSQLIGYRPDLHQASVSPLSVKSGEIAFHIPASIADTSDELIVQFSAGSERVKIKVR